jgi:hypothetical protein
VTGLTSLTGYCNDCEVALRSRLQNIHDSDTIGQLAFSVALQTPKPNTAYMELVVDTATNVVLNESTVLELPGAPATQYDGMGTPARPPDDKLPVVRVMQRRFIEHGAFGAKSLHI